MKRTIPTNRMGMICVPRSIILTFFLLISLSSLHAQFQNPGNGVIVYDNCEQFPQVSWGMDFKKGYAMVTGGNQTTSNPAPTANITLSTTYARKGTRSYRMHLEKRTDYPGCCEWVRSEVMWMSPSQQTKANEWRFAAVSILIDPSFQFENRPTQIGFDSKASPDDLQTPFWLGIMNGQYYVDGYFVGGTTYLGPVVKGVWEDWLLERNWSGGSDGFLRFYRNGKLVYEKYGPNYFTRSGDAPISRIQHGLYKWVWATSNGQGWGEGSPVSAANAPMNIYLDEIRFGTPSAKLSDFLLDQAAPAPLPNQSPTAQAGTNQNVTLPLPSITLTGSGTDPDGSIASYQWTKVSGPSGGNLQSPAAATTLVNPLTVGTYTFRLTVTDNSGATATDDVVITVASGNQPPTVQTGANLTTVLPDNTVNVTGTANDPDGTVTDYTWVKVSGPAGGNIADADAPATDITGLNEGVYVYRLTATDDDNAASSDDLTITVQAPPPNQLPTVQSGSNQTITLPVNTVTLSGTAGDPDGSIADFGWTKVSGPAGGVIGTPDAASTDITGLIAGVYVYRLTVTDNSGATAFDEVTITVNAAAPAPNAAPTVQAGANQTITLPTNTVSLTGTAADTDGTIADYTWTKVSGPAGGAIATADAAATDITGLIAGVYVYRISVTDNDGATDFDEVTITVNAAAPAPNTAPTVQAGANQTITLPTNTASLTGTAADADGTIADYTWTKVSGPAGGSIATADAAATDITGMIAGVYVYRITVTDNDGATDFDEVTITVNAAPVPNAAPTVQAGTNQTITLPTNTVSLTGTAADADGTVADYGWTKVSGPAGGAIATADAAATDITGMIAGVYVYRITVTDNDGATDFDEVTITVNAAAPAPNTAPTVQAGANQTITLPTNTASLTGTAADADGTIADYTWTKVSGPAGGAIATADAAATDITGMIAGVYVYRITVTDNDGATDFDEVTITVNAAAPAPNTAPTVQAGANQTITLPTNTASLTGTATDTDGTIADYTWTKVSGPAGGAIATAGAAATDITGMIAGVYVYRITVTDNDGATDFDEVTITVNAAAPAPNAAPTAQAGTNQTITLPTNTVSLTGTAADADGTIADYTWTKVSGPAGGAIAIADAASTDITGLIAGVYVYRITVTDNDGATDFDEVTITVNAAAPAPNTAPTVQAGANQTITLPTNTASLTGTAADADGTIADYTWTKVSGPAGGSIATADAAATDITGMIAGVYVYRITVTDNDGATDFDEVTITVNAAPVPNAAPTVQAGANQTITLPTNTVSLTGTAADADGTVADYGWTKVSGPAGGAIATADAAATDITGLIAGVYVYRITVTDNDGATDFDEVTITVNAAAPAPNTAPTVQAGANQTITLPTNTVSLTGTAADTDGTIADYTWTKVSGPAGGSIATADAAATDITGMIAGVYVYRITVTDNDGATDFDEVTITVNAAAPAPNTAPTVQAGANQTITLPVNTVSLTGTGTDADGTIADYTWTKVSGPAGGSIATTDAAATDITGMIAGVYVYRITVTDNDGATDFDEVTITVNAAPIPNAVPTVQAGANHNITLPTNTVTLSGTATDADGTIADFTWTKVSGPSGGIITTPDAVGTQITGLIAGVYVYRLTVTDNDGSTSFDNVQITVNAAPLPAPNVAPVAEAGNNKTITLPTNTTSLQGNGTDSDGSIATYAWTKVSGPAGGTIASPDAATTQITGLIAGTYVYRLTVTDNDGADNSDDVIVVVNPIAVAPNQEPTAAAGSDISIRLPVNAVTLNGSGADVDGQIATYLWTRVSGPQSGSFQAPTAQSTGMTGLTAGTYVVRLTVTDDNGATAFDEVQITVRPAPATPQPPANVAPQANAGADLRVALPTNVTTLNGTASDVDGTISSYSWTKVSGPGKGSLMNSKAQSTGVTELTAGSYIFRLSVTDDKGAQSTDDVRVLVVAAPVPTINQIPTAAAGNDRVITLPVNSISLRGVAADADGTIASYQWQKVSGPATGTLVTAAAAATTVSGLTEGEYIFRLTVTDDDGGKGTDDLKVTVLPAAPLPNQMPVADAGTDIELVLPANSGSLDGSKSDDPDGTIISYTWAMVKGPVTGTLTNANTAKPTLSNLVEGVYEFELTVIDNDGATAVDQVLVTVITSNAKPVVVMQDSITVLLPAQNTQLDASQSFDSDGSIKKYQWTKISGPGNANILAPGSSKTIVTDLVLGTYQFSVSIFDDAGAETKGIVTVLVKNSTARRLIPVVNLYPNPAETNVTLTIDSEVDGKSDVVFYDMLGRPVLRDTFNKNTRTYQRRINISNLPDGVYAVEIDIDQAEKVVRKVVKQ